MIATEPILARRGTPLVVRWFCLGLMATVLNATATEYFVSIKGDDTQAGTSRDHAFLTIQKGVSALQPGDTLTIGPGEYPENVRLTGFGDPARETLIRAERPGTVLLRGDREASAFEPIKGRRYAQVADYDGPVMGVTEVDTAKRLTRAAGIDALDISPGGYVHDAAAGKLYVSSSDFRPAAEHHYTVSVRRDHGFLIERSRRLVVDGLAASGFVAPSKDYVFLKANSGFMVIDSRQITLRRCTAFFNQGGITLHDGDKGVGGSNVVENCRAFGNGEGIACYYPNNTIFRDSVAFLNGSFGFNFYANRVGEVRFLRNVSWGNQAMDFQMKGGGLSGEDQHALAAQCIGLGGFSVYNLSHCIVGGENYYRRGDDARYANPMSPDNIALPRVEEPAPGSSAPDVAACLKQLDEFKDREFADPLNGDFRLQATSRFRQSVSNAPYAGPYEYRADIRYVAPGGNDRSDGLSMSNAWATVSHALGRLKPGDTLYIAGGRYSNAMPLQAKNVSIRGRGLEPVVIDGRFLIRKSAGVSLARLQFSGPVSVAGSRDMTIDNCVFAQPFDAAGARGLTITHGVFAGPLELNDASEIVLGGNLFAGSPGIRVDRPDGIVYAAYNNYADPARCREVAGRSQSRSDVERDADAYASFIQPDLAVDGGMVAVKNAYRFLGRGPLGTSIGLYREWTPLTVRVAGPRIHSVTESTANIEWWTSCPAHVELLWGETEACTNRVALDQTDYFSYSLTGLEPGKTYHLKIKPVYAPPAADPGRRIRVQEQAYAGATFTTDRRAAAPQTYYVTSSGRDDRDGLSRETAWGSLQHAADRVRPGDTVLLGGGEYRGMVYCLITGERDRPITFKAVPGEKAVIAGGGFTLNGKHYYRLDSLYFRSDEGSAIVIHHGSHLEVTRCHRIGGWSPAISASRTPDILVRNCAFFPGLGTINAERCPNLRLENNVMFGTMIYHVIIQNAPDEPFWLVNNIIGENTRGKQTGAPLCLLQVSSLVESNNCFFLRWPEDERRLFEIWQLPDRDRKVSPLFDVHAKEYFLGTLPEYRAVVRPTDSFVANPLLFGGTGTRQGWGPGISSNDFNHLLATSPELIKRGIGLQPDAFRDFHFKLTNWVFDVAWADRILAGRTVAEGLVKAGKDAEAVAAYIRLADLPMQSRLKSEFLERAAQCANRAKQYDRAVAIATNIPNPCLSARCLMRIMIDNGRYAELIKTFSFKAMGADPLINWVYPELDDVLVEIYGYRAIAYAETGDFTSAEADLKTMIDAQQRLGMFSSIGIVDRAWLKLGEHYRRYRKDDAKALEAYGQAMIRTMPNAYDRIVRKPVLLGMGDVLATATTEACEILRAQGREAEARKARFDMLVAQADAYGVLDRKADAIARLREALAVSGVTATEKAECERKIDALLARTEGAGIVSARAP